MRLSVFWATYYTGNISCMALPGTFEEVPMYRTYAPLNNVFKNNLGKECATAL